MWESTPQKHFWTFRSVAGIGILILPEIGFLVPKETRSPQEFIKNSRDSGSFWKLNRMKMAKREEEMEVRRAKTGRDHII